jgi:hypothetical protein
MNNFHHIERVCPWSQGDFQNVLKLAALPEFTLSTISTDLREIREGRLWFELRHNDGRGWILSLDVKFPTFAGLHDYQTKTGEYRAASDANSVAFDKMVEKKLGLNRFGEGL